MNNIASERKRRGMTQGELGVILGVTGQSVHNWENEKTPIKSTSLFEMSKLFDCSIDYLLGESDERKRITR